MTQPVVLEARVVTGAGGGPEKTILKSPRYLERHGYRTICAYMHPPGDPSLSQLRQKADDYGAEFVGIADRGAWDWRVVTQLAELCRRHQVSIWHGHDYKSNALGLLLSHYHSMRLVTTVHGWVKHTSRTPLYYAIDRLCLPRYGRVIAVSDDLYEACHKAGVRRDRLHLVENAIDCDEYTRRQSPRQARQALGLPTGAFTIGAVGRLSEEKGFDVLIRSVAQMRDAGRDVRLIILGEGDQRQGLQALIEELKLNSCCQLVGYCGKLLLWYEAMDCFALSSHREGLPNVLLEALAVGVPVVATRVNGVPRLVTHNHTGLLVEPGHVSELAHALCEVMDSPCLRETLSANGRRLVAEHYDFGERSRQIAGVYDLLTTSAGRLRAAAINE